MTGQNDVCLEQKYGVFVYICSHMLEKDLSFPFVRIIGLIQVDNFHL